MEKGRKESVASAHDLSTPVKLPIGDLPTTNKLPNPKAPPIDDILVISSSPLHTVHVPNGGLHRINGPEDFQFSSLRLHTFLEPSPTGSLV